MFIPLSVCTNNIRGLRIDDVSSKTPYSSSTTYAYLKPLAKQSDITILTETKVLARWGDGEAGNGADFQNTLNMQNFKPFGKNIEPIGYSCTGPGDGILVFINSETM